MTEPGRSVPSRSQLSALRRKYEEMLRLREADQAGSLVDPKLAMRGLASEFPGCLRELDTLSMRGLKQRCQELSVALAGGETSLWMLCSVRFHQELRQALWVKRAFGKHRGTLFSGANRDSAEVQQLANRLALEADEPIERALILDVMCRADGRLSALVIERIAKAEGVSVRRVKELVLPEHRPSRSFGKASSSSGGER